MVENLRAFPDKSSVLLLRQCTAPQIALNADPSFCNQMEVFRECWKRQGNDERTETKDA